MTNMNSNLDPSEKELERALHVFAQDAHLPESDEEIAAFFKSLDVSKVPTPNVAKFEARLAKELHGQPKAGSKSWREILKGLDPRASLSAAPAPRAVAARKRKKITPQTLEAMDKAKKKSHQ